MGDPTGSADNPVGRSVALAAATNLGEGPGLNPDLFRFQGATMADLYIANCTKQEHDFVFQLPESRSHHKRLIPAGGQIRLKDISPDTATAIIDHHALYGMRDLAKIKNEKVFVGLCYSEKEIKLSGIASAIEHNYATLVEEGIKLRNAAAVAADQAILSNGIDGEELKHTTVEMREIEDREGQRPTTVINEVRSVKPEPGQADRRGKNNPAKIARMAQ
jgi:hypothetical protein